MVSPERLKFLATRLGGAHHGPELAVLLDRRQQGITHERRIRAIAASDRLLQELVSFVTAWVLAGASTIAWHFYGGGYLVAALLTAVILWAGFTAARFITHDAFEGRPSSLTVLNIAHELVTIVVMAIIIGVWPPAGTV